MAVSATTPRAAGRPAPTTSDRQPAPTTPARQREGRILLGIPALIFLLMQSGCIYCPNSAGGLGRVGTVGAVSVPMGDASGYFGDPVVIEGLVGAPPSEVWPRLVAAYREAGLTPDLVDQPNLIIASRGMLLSGRLGTSNLSTFLDCGENDGGRLYADVSRVAAGITSRLRPRGRWGDTTQVYTRLEGFALPTDTAAGRVLACRTTGLMERRILSQLHSYVETVIDVDPCQQPDARRYVDPIRSGMQVRVRVGPTETATGGVVCILPDTLMITRGAGRDPIPIAEIQGLEIRRERDSYGWHGAVVGALLGGVTGASTGLGIGGRAEKQGKILSPGIGAIVGGLLGAYLGSRFRGDYWEAVSVGVLRAGGSGER